MMALACAGSPHFVPSLLEGSDDIAQLNYSILTVRKMASKLSEGDRLYFLLGADAFQDVAHWYQPLELLDSCDCIIVSRPGFPIAEIEKVIPNELRGGAVTDSSVRLRRTTLHLLNTVTADVSSSAIRRAAAEGKSVHGMVPDAVAEYIEKLRLYQNG